MKNISKQLIMFIGLLALLTLFQNKALAQNNGMSAPLTPVCKWEIRTDPDPICKFDTLHIYAVQVLQPGCTACSSQHSNSYPQYYKIMGSGGPIKNGYSNPYTWTDAYQQPLCNGQGKKIPPPLNPGTYTIYASRYQNFDTIVDQKTIIVYGEESVNFSETYNLSSSCDQLGVGVALTGNAMPNTSISVLLHAPNPAYDLQWILYNSFSHYFTITLWGTYIIETEISNSCFDSIHFDTINIPGPFFTTTGFDCPSNAISFQGNSVNCVNQILTWHWDFGDGNTASGQSPSHPYQNPGTYTVTLIATGASPLYQADTITQQVIVHSPPANPVFTGPFNTCHGANTNYTINPYYTTGFSYYYTIGLNGTHHIINNHIFSVNWAGSYGGVLYVNVTENATGCSSRDSLKVFKCCDVSHGSLLPRYQDTTFTAAPSANSFVINGILTINGTFSLNAKFIYLGPNAKIIVNPSRTLTISNSTLVVGCDTMWDGIYLNYANSGLIVNSNSNIRDAKNAIVSNACAVYTITNSTFNNNYRNIVVQSCSGMNNSTISSSTLTCTTTLKPQYPPIAAIRTYSGIEISNVGSITVGNTASAANRNHFNNMDFGIKNNISTLAVYNNTFSNMTAAGIPSFPPTSGVGILSSSNKSYQKSLTVGGVAGSINTNRFESCYQGIYADYFQNITIQRDTFLSTNQWTSIFLYEHTAKTIKILNNVITDGIAGISFVDCQNATTDINSNSISNCFYGIRVQNVIPDGVQKLNIYANTIINNTYGDGIGVTNIQGISGSQTQIALISNNYVYINNPDFNLPYTSNGILVGNSPYAYIQSNNVYRSTGNSITDPTTALKLNGIFVQVSPNSVLCSNTLYRMGCGLKFYGPMPDSKLQRNSMQYFYYGVRLDTANISRQGDTTYAWANYWSPTTSGNFRIQGTPSVLTKWNYTGPLLFTNQYCPVPYSVSPINFLQLINKSSNITSCAIPVQLPLSMQYNPIVNNSYNYILAPDENRYWDKQYFYNDMQNSPSLLSSLSLSNSSYQSFYNAIDLSNIGQFARVNALMNTQDYSNAEIYNTSIIPQNNIEQNRKAVNTIYLNTWAKRRFEFTNNEHADLEAIALQSPILGGDAVFSARVMLGISTPSANAVKRMNQNVTTTAISSVGSIYPNPAKDMAYLDYSLIEGQTAYLYFYNTMGTPVKSFSLNSQSNRFEFSTKDFKTGLYFYRIILNNNQLLESNKLIIIK